MHHHDLETFGNFRDRRKVLDRVVTGIYRHSRDHCERARVSDHQRIAIRGDPATARAPIAPPAPARFSTITGCPSLDGRICDASRAGKSLGPPAAAATTILMGWVG